MGSSWTAELAALETVERVLVSLRLLPDDERDEPITRLIETIERDRDRLLFGMLAPG